MKPMIGITCNIDKTGQAGTVTNMGLPSQAFHLVADDYVRAVENAGGIPVLIPLCGSFETVKALLDRVDGVLLTGGNDVDPTRYGEFIQKEVGQLEPERDEQDLAVARYVVENTQKPLLCICRGIQVLNVALGGTLFQDLGKAGHCDHFVGCSPQTHPVHQVKITPNTLLADIIGAEELAVNSYHHQAVKQLAPGLVAGAVATEDGTIESIELPGERMVLATQWHPEMMYTTPLQQKVFERLVQQAAR